jgi:formate dehydrogenase subunit gamma
MHDTLSRFTRNLLAGLVLGGVMLAGATAQTAVSSAPTASTGPAAQAAVVNPNGPPAGFTAPAEPRPDETNAERAKSQPGNNAPAWRAVRDSGLQPGVTNLPGAEKGVLVQSFVKYPGSSFTTAGEAWRQVRNQWIIPYGGALFLITAAAIGLFYWKHGPVGGHEPDTGRLIERFSYFERVAHWSMAISFVVLAVSGLVLAFGKFFLLPILGGTLFGWLSYALKNVHNFAGPLFAVALVIFIVTYVRDNIPSKADLTWLIEGGGIFREKAAPSPRFNAGEKIVFWCGVIFLGLGIVGSGLVLNQLTPGVAYTRGNMQVAHIVHAVASMLMMAMILGHIYLGSVGVKGAYQGMRTGYVDEAWAKEHHELWYDDIKAGRVPAQRSRSSGATGLAPMTPQG